MRLRTRENANQAIWEKAAPAAAAVVAILLAGACSVVEMSSRWNTAPVVVNGLADEWKGELVPDKEKGISVGVKNDAAFLYVCVVGDTPALRMMAVSRGMTVWLDPAGGKAKAFGVKFPLGPEAAPAAAPAPAAGGARGGAGRPAPVTNEVIIFGPEKGAEKRVPIRDLKGIEIRAAVSKGVFAYELKVPLAARPEFPYALGAAASPFVGIGIEIPAVHRGDSGGSPGGGGEDMGGGGGAIGGGEAGGGLSEGGGGGRGGGGGMRGGGGMSGANGLYFWAKVALAKG